MNALAILFQYVAPTKLQHYDYGNS
jgi:hypothetical protein